MGTDSEFDFDVAISFAGEDRALVREVADLMKAEGIRTFFDEDFAVEMWGEDLVEYFEQIYGKRARHMLMFMSHSYAEKAWPGQERRVGLARALEMENAAYILPVRLDDADPPPGVGTTRGFLDIRRLGTKGLAEAVALKLQPASPSAPTRTPRVQHEVDALLRERPAYWEFLMFSGTLYVEMQALEDKYLDLEVGYSRPTGEAVSGSDLVSLMTAAFDELQRIVSQVEHVFSEDAQERALGKPGEPGSPERIRHLARRMTAVYEDLLDWALRLRGLSVPAEAQEAVRLLSALAKQPVAEYRAFVEEAVTSLDDIEERAKEGTEEDPVEIEILWTLSMDPAATQEYLDEAGRLLGT